MIEEGPVLQTLPLNATCTSTTPFSATKVVLQFFVILMVEENAPWHVIVFVGLELTVVPPLDAVEPDAVATSDTEAAEEVNVPLHVPLWPAPSVDGVTANVCGDVGVLLVEPVWNVIASLTETLYIVPIPVFLTVPLTG